MRALEDRWEGLSKGWYDGNGMIAGVGIIGTGMIGRLAWDKTTAGMGGSDRWQAMTIGTGRRGG